MGANMFADLPPAPPDSILGLNEAFRADPRPSKINLGIGVYQDEAGNTPILPTVAEVERRLVADAVTKTYRPIAGSRRFTEPVRALVFGDAHTALRDGRVATLQTPGGTGALRVAADLLCRLADLRSTTRPAVWVSTPTWPNHAQIFRAAGLAIWRYPYLTEDSVGLDLERLLETLALATPGDVVVLHACCHNPTGIDLTEEAWREVVRVVSARGLLPVLDFAYQGFGDGLDEDAGAVRKLVEEVGTVLVASSMSKNFAVYSERVGALSVVAATAKEAAILLSHATAVARAIYSNPPSHGSDIVAAILGDRGLRARWEQEVEGMRRRITGNRARLVAQLAVSGIDGDREFALDGLLRRRGMFVLLGLSPAQVTRLREEFAVYVVDGGRINVAGLTEANTGPVCAALAAVMRVAS
jgi:aspartate/tyrosine/aromatic aminotransferase